MLIIIVSRGWHLSGTPPFRKETPKKERRRRSRRRGCGGRATIRKQSINPNISRKTDFWVSGCRIGGLDTRCALPPWASSSSLFLKEHVTPRGAAGQKKRFSLCILVNQRYSGESGRGQWQVVRWDGTGSVSLREETITPPFEQTTSSSLSVPSVLEYVDRWRCSWGHCCICQSWLVQLQCIPLISVKQLFHL